MIQYFEYSTHDGSMVKITVIHLKKTLLNGDLEGAAI